MKHWTVMLEDLLKNTCVQEFPFLAQHPDSDLMQAIHEISYYKNPPAGLIELVRDEWWPTLEPRMRKHTEKQTIVLPMRSDQKIDACMITSSVAGLGALVGGIAGFTEGLVAGAGFSYAIHRILNKAELSFFPKQVKLSLNALKELPLSCWKEAIQSSSQTYQKGLEETTTLLQQCMDYVFESVLVKKKPRLLCLISETAEFYTPKQKGQHIQQILRNELCEIFDNCIDNDYLSNELSWKARKVYTLASLVAGVLVGARSMSVPVGVLCGSLCLGFLYVLHKAITSRRRTPEEKELLKQCFSQLAPEVYIDALKKSILPYRRFLEEQGAREHIALILDDEVI